MEEIIIKLSEDEVLVLFEFFERFDDKGKLYFVHPAEYLALMKISAQVDQSTSAMFDRNYRKLLCEAREKIAGNFESDFPEIEKE